MINLGFCTVTVISLLLITGSSTAKTIFKRPCQDMSTQCLTKTIQSAIPIFIKGLPEYGIETLDPYHIEKLDLTLPGGIVIQFLRGNATGLKKCTVDFARLRGNTFEVQYHCNLTIKGRYKSSGRMLMFPIDGDGESTIKCNELRINCELNLGSKVESDGRKYLEIKSANITHSYDGRVSYSMTNLFKRNTQINNAILDFMNSNWRMVAEEFGAPLVEFGSNCVMTNLRRLLRFMPMEQIITEPIGFRGLKK